MKKSVFVTGATNGTGYAIAARFAREGYDVFIGSRRQEDARAAAGKIAADYGVFAQGYETKIHDEQNVKEVFADIREKGYLLSSLVLNAANLGICQDTLSVSIKDFEEVYRVNIFWNFMLAREAAFQMKEAGGGAIVFINSNTALRAIPARAAYCSSKSGALGLMRALAIDLGPYGVRVNAVLPGMIKTARWETNYNNCRNALTNFTPIGDIASFEDIANAAWYLGSAESGNVTGSELVVDGGNCAQLAPTLSHYRKHIENDAE